MRRSGGVELIDNGAYIQIADHEFDVSDNGDSPYQSDFEHMIAMREAAHVGPDGSFLDDLDQKFRVMELEKAEQDAKSPQVSINPASWDRGSLGGIAAAQPNLIGFSGPTPIPDPTAPGQLNTIVFWPGDDRESCPVTITLSPLIGSVVEGAPVVAVTDTVERPVARIRWGTKNGQFTADVDVGTGVEFCVEAASVYVSAYMDKGSTVPMNLMASIGFYAAARLSPATRTVYIDNLGVGDVERIVRPNFATAITGFERPDATDQYVITMYTINGTTIIGQRVIAPSNYLDTPLVLPNDCYYVDVTNNGGGTSSSRIIFGLF